MSIRKPFNHPQPNRAPSCQPSDVPRSTLDPYGMHVCIYMHIYRSVHTSSLIQLSSSEETEARFFKTRGSNRSDPKFAIPFAVSKESAESCFIVVDLGGLEPPEAPFLGPKANAMKKHSLATVGRVALRKRRNMKKAHWTLVPHRNKSHGIHIDLNISG